MRLIACLFFLFGVSQKSNAQTADTNYVDTVSMAHIDSATQSAEQNTGYDDEDDGYVDTTIKHVYDSSEYFFNWKEYYDDAFTNKKISQRHLIDEDVNELKKENDFWYIPVIEKLETRLKNDPAFRDSLIKAHNLELTDRNKDNILMQPWFNTLLWTIIIIIFLGAVIYFLLQNKISIFSKEPALSSEEMDDEETEDIFHLSYTKLIQKAEKEKDYRAAVRLMFLQIIKSLSETNHIHYQPDYTNLHYLQQLHDSKYYNEFFKIMRNYEYVWYGKFDIAMERYTLIKKDFLTLQNKIT